MGFLKNMFVEEIPNDDYEDVVETMNETDVEVNYEEVDNLDTLIDEVYNQNDLYDKSKSIFKVEELINSLPKEMVTETKKASVLAILTSFGLTATDVTLDGERRIEVLNGVLRNITTTGDADISEMNTEIENRKKEIADLEKKIADRQNEVKVSDEKISSETARINELMKFVGGTN